MTALRTLISVALFSIFLNGCVSYVEDASGQRIDKKNNSQVITINLDLARSYIQEGDGTSAIRALQNAERSSPSDRQQAEIYSLYGIAYGIQGEDELVERYFDKALDVEPSSSILNNYGAWLYSAGKYEKALEMYSRAVADERYSERARVYENMGYVSLRLDRPEKAKTYFNRAVRIDSRLPIAWFYLSRFSADAGEYKKAQEQFHEYASLVLEKSSAALWLGIEIAFQLKDYNQVASYGLQLRNRYPDSEEWKRYEALRNEHSQLF